MATAVWVYKKQGEEHGSIELSIKSAQRFLEGVDRFVVCGDNPEIEGVDWIPSPTITQDVYRAAAGQKYAKKWRKWVDSVHKMLKIIDSPLVDEQFIWLYDDTFFLKPTHIVEFAIPLYNRNLGKSLAEKHKDNTWRQCRLRSSIALTNAGYESLDFSTHAPLVFEKTKLQETIDTFECYTRPRVIESMYGNHHFGKSAKKSRQNRSLFRYITRGGSIPAAKCTNVGNGHFARYKAKITRIVTGEPVPSVDIIVPWRQSPGRIKSRRWVRENLESKGKTVFSDCRGEWNKYKAINAGVGMFAEQLPNDVLAFVDADCAVPNVAWNKGINKARETGRLVFPHDSYCRTTKEQADLVCNHRCPTKGPKQTWFKGNREGCPADGGIVFIRRDSFEKIGHWNAGFMELAEEALGPPIRLNFTLFHLWHDHAASMSSNSGEKTLPSPTSLGSS